MKLINKFLQNKFLLGLVVVVFLVLMMRLWSFGGLLTFKMDQARDIKLIEEAYNGGVGELPLLGPRAAKTYLRLGPIFYYFEYLAMLIFGDQPWSVAVPDLIFSILTIPLFYYFLRQAFGKKVSFLTTVVFASSFFLNQYGRFAWNPNSIPFWSLLYFLGLYKLVYGSRFTVHSLVHSSRFTVHGGGRWLLVAVIGYGVASQLHFTAMLAYPLIGALFVLAVALWESWKWSGLEKSREGKDRSKNKKILSIDYLTIRSFGVFFWRLWRRVGWKYWLGAVAILGMMYLPVVLSELYTHGDNWVQFKYALSGRGKPEFSLLAKIIQSVKLHSEYFWFGLTSFGGGENKFFVVGFLGIVAGVMFSVWKKLQDTRYKIQINDKSQMTNDKEMINDGGEMINDKLQMINGEEEMTNDKLQMTNDEEEMTNDKLQMTNGGGEMINDIGVNKTEKPPILPFAKGGMTPFTPLRQNDFEGQAPGVDDRVIFFILVGVWWMVMVLLYTKLAFSVLKPRYWLLEAPIFFVVLAVFLEGLFKNSIKKIKGKYIAYLIVIVLAGMNLWATGNWYWELKNQKDSSLFLWHLKLKDQNEIPWGQLNKVVNYIEGDVLTLAKKENKDVCFYTTGEYRPVYDYIFERRGISNKNFLENEVKNISVVRRISFSKDSDDNCLFIAIDHNQHREIPRIPKDHKDEFEKVEKKEIGFVTVWKLSRKSKVDPTSLKLRGTRSQKLNDKSQMTNDGGKMTNDKLQMTNDSEEITNDKSQMTNDGGKMTNDKSQITKERIKKPRRVERVRWKDILPLRKYK